MSINNNTKFIQNNIKYIYIYITNFILFYYNIYDTYSFSGI